MSQSRQLAAIMFTDIVGYSAMMQEDEILPLQVRSKFKKILEEEVNAHRGQIAELRGDGSLCIFSSTIEGVNAAIALQLEMQKRPIVPLRIGIHTGDIIIDGNNIYGDGVNIASRIESFGISGSIFISAKAYDDIKNQKRIQTISLGKYIFKNVKEPLEIFAVSNEGIQIPDSNFLEGKGEKLKERFVEKSIAVLPFANMSSDPEQEYFSDGMAEEILNSLTHLKDLKVAGRTSSFQFKGKNIDLREVGDKLGVSTILEGSVRKQGNRIRITTQLVNVNDGFHLWSEKYDRDYNDIFTIQDEIALAVTEKLKITLLAKDREQITKIYTQNTEAYELYLKGRFFLARRGPFILTAIEYFKKAIELDPDFSLGHAGYADANFISAFYSLQPGNKVMHIGKEAAEKAIRLDPTLCEPYTSLGFYYTALMWNWTEGKKYFNKSIELNPRYATGHYLFGLYYYAWVMGIFDIADEHCRTAVNLEPLSAIAYAIYSGVLIAGGKFEKALSIAKAGAELDANSFLCNRSIEMCYRALKKYDEAIESAEQLLKISKRHPHAICDLMGIYAETGRSDKVKILMQELKQRYAIEFIDAVYMGIAAAHAENMDDAFKYLDAALIEKDPMLITLKHMKYSKALENDSRFQKLLQRIGFPE